MKPEPSSSTCNRLASDKVDNEVVWGVITRDLPALHKTVEDLLGKP